MLVGNDIVDLAEPEARGKHRNGRFLERVFSQAEQAGIAGAERPDLALWILWAGKESAFKIAAKRDPDACFSPRKLAFAGEALRGLQHSPLHGERRAFRRMHGLVLEFSWCWNADFVHCLAIWAGEQAGMQVRHRIGLVGSIGGGQSLCPEEEESVHSPASREARHLARSLLEGSAGHARMRILRKSRDGRLLPPGLWQEGRPAESWDLSLSHDGRFAAAAVAARASGVS